MAAYKAALDHGIAPAVLLARASRYAEAAKKFTEAKYVKHPAGWLEERWWEKESYGRAPRAKTPAWNSGTFVLGFQLRSVTKTVDECPTGVMVIDFHRESPLSGDDAEVHGDDIIVQVNGKPVKNPEQVRKQVKLARDNGDASVELMVKRRQVTDSGRVIDKWEDADVIVPLPALDAPPFVPPEQHVAQDVDVEQPAPPVVEPPASPVVELAPSSVTAPPARTVAEIFNDWAKGGSDEVYEAELGHLRALGASQEAIDKAVADAREKHILELSKNRKPQPAMAMTGDFG
jgi:hypothetical protein